MAVHNESAVMCGVVRIAEDGTMAAVYDDGLADVLRGLGRLDVKRASHVEYDNAAAGWLVELVEPSDVRGVLVGPFGMRAAALEWERVYLTARLDGLDDAAASHLARRTECHKLSK